MHFDVDVRLLDFSFHFLPVVWFFLIVILMPAKARSSGLLGGALGRLSHFIDSKFAISACTSVFIAESKVLSQSDSLVLELVLIVVFFVGFGVAAGDFDCFIV